MQVAAPSEGSGFHLCRVACFRGGALRRRAASLPTWLLHQVRRPRDPELPADRPDHAGLDLAVARDRRARTSAGRRPPRVLCALAVEAAAVRREVALEVAALHAAKVSSSASLRAPGGTSTAFPPAWSRT